MFHVIEYYIKPNKWTFNRSKYIDRYVDNYIGVVNTWGMVGKFRGDDPRYGGFWIWWGAYFIPQHTVIDPLFLQKKSVCLYHI